MEEIKVGEYVRTDKGSIIKITSSRDIGYLEEEYPGFKKTIIKHNKNIIDLIEIGDVIKYKELTADDLDTYNVHCMIFNFATRGMNAQVYHRDTITQEVYEVYICLYDCYGFSRIKNIKVNSKEYEENFDNRTGYLK